MIRFRPKLGTERDSEWRCLFCLHVRTGTILLGSWHLILHLIALGFLAATVRDPRLLTELEKDSRTVPNWGDEGSEMPTPLSNIDSPKQYAQQFPQPRDNTLVYHEVDVGGLVTLVTVAITLMLIYGAARGKPAHVLPFFCLQIFDFAITILTATGYLCYLRSVHRLVAEARRVPYRAALLRLPAPALSLVVLMAFLLAVLVKGYCISVVWRCYKYLTMRAHALHCLSPFMAAGEGAAAGGEGGAPATPPLPAYDEAIKQSPPPSYRDATRMNVNNNMSPVSTESATTNTVVFLPQQGEQARV